MKYIFNSFKDIFKKVKLNISIDIGRYFIVTEDS